MGCVGPSSTCDREQRKRGPVVEVEACHVAGGRDRLGDHRPRCCCSSGPAQICVFRPPKGSRERIPSVTGGAGRVSVVPRRTGRWLEGLIGTVLASGKGQWNQRREQEYRPTHRALLHVLRLTTTKFASGRRTGPTRWRIEKWCARDCSHTRGARSLYENRLRAKSPECAGSRDLARLPHASKSRPSIEAREPVHGAARRGV